MNERETYSRIVEKYSNQFYKLTDLPLIGVKVVYLPKYDSMIYNLHDGAYDYFQFSPGDYMTIKKLFKQYPKDNFLCVKVSENNSIFTPAHFIPVNEFDQNDLRTIQEIFEVKKIERKLKDGDRV